jgi:copper resistance protein B
MMQSNRWRLAALAWLALLNSAAAEMNDEPLLWFVGADEFEWRSGDTDHMIAWDIDAWYGTTRDRAVLRAEGEVEHGDTEEFETVIGYARAMTPYWNANIGWHADWQLSKPRHWATVEWEGLAPGFVQTRFQLLAGEGGRYSARVKLETEWFLSRSWLLEPTLKTDWYSEADRPNRLGSGWSGFDAGLRLKYRIHPRSMPYVGVQLTRLAGDTARLARANGQKARALSVVAGLSFWF